MGFFQRPVQAHGTDKKFETLYLEKKENISCFSAISKRLLFGVLNVFLSSVNVKQGYFSYFGKEYARELYISGMVVWFKLQEKTLQIHGNMKNFGNL